MSRAFHEACNTTLRTAVADLLSTGLAGFVFLGCAASDEGLGWVTLPGLTRALDEECERRFTNGFDLAAVYEVIAELAAALPPWAVPEDPEHLRGIALVSNVDIEERGRVCLADAVFTDAWRHFVGWYTAEAAPFHGITSPPEIVDNGLLPQEALPVLLTAALEAAGQGARVAGEDQQSLSVCLRDLIADLTAKRCHAVFVIARTKDGWDAIPANDLAATVGAAVDAGADLACAVGMLADELREDPPVTIPTLQGVGTVVHYDHDDGTTEAQMVAVGDAFLHAASWTHGHERPDWQILPVTEAEADPEYEPMVSAYTRLLTAIRGTHR
jgi:hypothetical protein